MEHVDGFGHLVPAAEIGPGDEGTGALVDIALACVGLQREDVGRITWIWESELAQTRHWRFAQHGNRLSRIAG